jgi:nitrogen fixation NifU-like protein
MPSEQDIYEEHVLDHYEDPYHRGDCEHATHAEEGNNPLCGDKVRIELEIDDEGKIQQAWFEGEGCVISQASTSMLMERIEGFSLDALKAFSAEEMLELFGPKLTPNRQKCCLLSWRVVQAAVHAPVDGEEDEDGDAGTTHFGGPSLGEEA